jgi:hypothetical protein
VTLCSYDHGNLQLSHGLGSGLVCVVVKLSLLGVRFFAGVELLSLDIQCRHSSVEPSNPAST